MENFEPKSQRVWTGFKCHYLGTENISKTYSSCVLLYMVYGLNPIYTGSNIYLCVCMGWIPYTQVVTYTSVCVYLNLSTYLYIYIYICMHLYLYAIYICYVNASYGAHNPNLMNTPKNEKHLRKHFICSTFVNFIKMDGTGDHYVEQDKSSSKNLNKYYTHRWNLELKWMIIMRCEYKRGTVWE
jgi:hypothetical protein